MDLSNQPTQHLDCRVPCIFQFQVNYEEIWSWKSCIQPGYREEGVFFQRELRSGSTLGGRASFWRAGGVYENLNCCSWHPYARNSTVMTKLQVFCRWSAVDDDCECVRFLDENPSTWFNDATAKRHIKRNKRMLQSCAKGFCPFARCQRYFSWVIFRRFCRGWPRMWS